VNTSAIAALVFAASVVGPIVANAQTAGPAAPNHHSQVRRFHGPHHYAHRHFVAHPAPVAAPAAATTTAPAPMAPFGLSLPSFKPLPDNKGDEDGLSGDVNDCNKGCIDGNPE
jgi:hypothetical protein